MEIESLDALDDHLDEGGSLQGLRLQNLDLTGYAAALRAHRDLTGLVVLGGVVPADVADVLHRGGAIVFPSVVDAPIDPWRGLYYPEDLYAGLENGYATTPDARAYAWSIDGRLRTDAYATLVRAIHDDSVTDDLDEFVQGRSCVGVMGGHALHRGSAGYAEAAELGRRLAASGHVVITGGGPGAMEAANLGAFCADPAALSHAVQQLAAVPFFRPDTTAWASVAMQLRRELLGDEPMVPAETLGPSARSLGIPTWFYGHEPPNVFCDVRGEVLLQRDPRGRPARQEQRRHRRVVGGGRHGAGDLPGGDPPVLRAGRGGAPSAGARRATALVRDGAGLARPAAARFGTTRGGRAPPRGLPRRGPPPAGPAAVDPGAPRAGRRTPVGWGTTFEPAASCSTTIRSIPVADREVPR